MWLTDKRLTKSLGRSPDNWRKGHLGVIWSVYCFIFYIVWCLLCHILTAYSPFWYRYICINGFKTQFKWQKPTLTKAVDWKWNGYCVGRCGNAFLIGSWFNTNDSYSSAIHNSCRQKTNTEESTTCVNKLFNKLCQEPNGKTRERYQHFWHTE